MLRRPSVHEPGRQARYEVPDTGKKSEARRPAPMPTVQKKPEGRLEGRDRGPDNSGRDLSLFVRIRQLVAKRERPKPVPPNQRPAKTETVRTSVKVTGCCRPS